MKVKTNPPSATSYHWREQIVAFIFGAINTLAFSPFDYWPLAILSSCALLILLTRCLAGGGHSRALWIGLWWGIGHFSTGGSWVFVCIEEFGGMPLVANVLLVAVLVLYVSLFPALFAWLFARLQRPEKGVGMSRFIPRLTLSPFVSLCLLAPNVWMLCDWLRGTLLTGLPWLWLGYSQISSPFAAFAPIGGVDLVTYVVVTVAGALAYACYYRRQSGIRLAVGLGLVALILRPIEWVEVKQDTTTHFAIIQGNISQHLKWLPSQLWPTLNQYHDSSSANWDADVIIWPEAAIPTLERYLPAFLTSLDEEARGTHSAILTGIITIDDSEHFYNTVLALGETPEKRYHYASENRYYKHHLLPFGEYVPFDKLLRPLAPLFDLPMNSFTKGAAIQPNVIANGRHFSIALCYEILFNEQIRQNITQQTDYILTLSNDSWFGHSIGPWQHKQIAQMRALELGRPLIRSTNNGVTMVTDHHGQILKQLPQFEEAVLDISLPTARGLTPYAQYGTLPLKLWAVLCALLLLFVFNNPRREDSDNVADN